MSGGADKIPRYSHRGPGTSPPDWQPDDDDIRRPDAPQRGAVLRGLSVVPFALVAAIGLIAAISWPLVIVFGLGGGEPIWDWAKGHTLLARARAGPGRRRHRPHPCGGDGPGLLGA